MVLCISPVYAERARAVPIPPPAGDFQFQAGCGNFAPEALTVDRLKALSTNSGPPVPSASLESAVVYGIASVLASRAKAELQAYAIQKLKDVACEAGRVAWFPSSCTFLQTGDDELPIVFGPGLRSALADDVTHLPQRLIDGFPHDLRGTGKELLAVLFVESVKLLVTRADIYQVAHQMVALTSSGEDEFTCEKTDVTCGAVHKAVALGGAVLVAALTKGDPSDATREKAVIRCVLATGQPAPAITDDQLTRLVGAIEEARAHAKLVKAAEGDKARLAEVKPLVQAIVEAVDVLLEVAQSPEHLPRGLPELVDGLARGEPTAIVSAAVTVFKTLPGADKMSPVVLRVISFAAEITQAKTPEDAAAAIDAVIAPIGAYRMKRSERMISLGGLVGLAGGWELLSSSRLHAGDNARGGVVAPVAMVGVDLSMPLRNPYVPDLGLFVSVIDVGSLMSFRWSIDPITVTVPGGADAQASVSNTNVVGFAQVLSPGLFARARLGGSPIVAAFGAAFVPHAREIDEVMGSIEASAVRLSLSLSVDVTLLPFHW